MFFFLKDRKKEFFYDPVVVAKRLKFYEDSLIDFALSTEYGRRMALRLMNKKDMKKGDSLLIKHLLFWRSGRDSNSRYPEVHCISSAARYDHFDTTPQRVR